MPRLERVVLPCPEWLTSAARGAHSVDPFESSRPQYEAQLNRTPHASVAPAWALMKSLRGGVSQEAMRDADSYCRELKVR